MADSSNSSTTSSTTSSSTGSQTSSTPSTSKANGNFSGGTGSFSIGNGYTPTSETNAAHASGVEGPGLSNGSFGSSWSNNGNSGSGKGDYTYNGQSYNNNNKSTTTPTTTTASSSTTLTVDDVFSTGSGVNGVSANPYNNGDYEASKNESSNVDTSTFGNQSSIVTSPTLTMQDKGLVDNNAIESVEGLNFQQKDKESQDVMEARKARDEAESEDKANQMRDSLKAKTDKTVDEKAINEFQIGNDDIENLYTKVSEEKGQDLQSKSDILTQKTNDMKDAEAKLLAAEEKQSNLKTELDQLESKKKEELDKMSHMLDSIENLTEGKSTPGAAVKAITERKSYKNMLFDLKNMADTYGVDVGDLTTLNIKYIGNKISEVSEVVNEHFENKEKPLISDLGIANEDVEKAQAIYDEAKKANEAAKEVYDKALREYDNLAATKGAFRNNINSIKSAYENGEIDANKAVAMLKNMSLMADYSPLGLTTADMVYLAGGLDGNYIAANPSALQTRYVGAEAEWDKAKADLITASKVLNEDLKGTVPLTDGVSKGEAVVIEKIDGGKESLIKYDYSGTDPEVQAAVDRYNEAVDNYANAYTTAKTAFAKYEAAEEATTKPTAVTEYTTTSNAEASIQAAREALESSDLSPEQKAQAEQTLADIETSREAVVAAAGKLTNNIKNANPADIDVYVNVTKQYEKNLEAALKGNPFTKTDFNKPFVESIAKANDFDVTLADGTKTSYSEYAADMATKSPEIASAMYNVKADRLEAEGHNVLAKIERAKAAMVDTWIGSKLTQADNQVRGQFNQMAKTNMRATYAAYNNVLNDPNATPEQKAEASEAINQANSLMRASVALQASTGFFSGIGDSMKDGVYGVADPEALNAYQKTLNAIDNFAKITLGLGVTPGANRAYQNMYYMTGAKVNSSALFSKDFDSDGFALCQEYGNNAAAGMITGVGELATGVALLFNPSMSGIGLNLVIDSITTFTNGLYGVQKEARKAQKYTKEVVSYFNEAKDIAEQSGDKEAVDLITDAITQIENFELKSDEVGNLDNWLEGSGSNTATNEKFNQSLSYDEWLKLIEADPTMRNYAKGLVDKENDKKNNANSGVDTRD